MIGVTRRRRIIPAHAGFTQGDPRSPPAPADHPRTRGVYALSGARRVGSCGSSPQTRGLRVGVREPAETGRIIPAHAGFTRWTGTIAHTVAGSSPHTRGLRDALTVHAPHMHHPRTRGVYVRASPTCTVTEGIIPAHAGFTTSRWSGASRPGHHPRTRGVYLHWPFSLTAPWASSPHTRGLLPQITRTF